MLCSLIGGYQHFVGMFCFPLQVAILLHCRWRQQVPLKCFCKTTWCPTQKISIFTTPIMSNLSLFCNKFVYFSDGNIDTMLYAVLWLPSHFTQLYMYVITLSMACIVIVFTLCQNVWCKIRHKLRKTVNNTMHGV
jgi:hypothetical protein